MILSLSDSSIGPAHVKMSAWRYENLKLTSSEMATCSMVEHKNKLASRLTKYVTKQYLRCLVELSSS